MNRTYMAGRNETPLWAVFGAPLVGVPLMVLLLALAAPRQPAPDGGQHTEVSVERVEAEVAERAAQVRTEERDAIAERS